MDRWIGHCPPTAAPLLGFGHVVVVLEPTADDGDDADAASKSLDGLSETQIV